MKVPTYISKNIDLIVMLSWYVIYLVHFTFFHGGYFGFDDIEYCRLAQSVVAGEFTHDSLYAHRYAGFLPLALFYYLFGVNDFANFISGMAVFSLTLYLILTLIKDISSVYKWVLSSMIGLAPMYLMYTEKPMPDMMVAFGFLMCFGSYVSIRFDTGMFKHHVVMFVSGALFMFLAKETFLIFYPFFVALMVYDLFRKQRVQYWQRIIMSLLFFSILFMVFSWVIFEDPIARLHHIFQGQYVSACSYDLLPLTATIQRIGYQMWLELMRNLYLVPFCFVPFLWWNENSKINFIAKSFVALLLLANFMTISYSSYVPLCPDPRHHMYILPLGAIVFTYGVSKVMNLTIRQVWLVLLLLLLQLGLSVNYSYENTWLFYLPIVLGIYLGHRNYKNTMIGLVLIGLTSIFVFNSIYNKKVNYTDQKKLNDFVINEVPGFKYAITDRVNHNFGLLHSKFDTTSVKFIDFKELDTIGFRPLVPKYLLSNGMSSYLSNTNWDKLPDYIKTAHEKSPKVYENKAGTVYLLK